MRIHHENNIKDDESLFMQFAARKAFTIDGGLQTIGWQGETSVNWRSDKTPFGQGGARYYVLNARVKYANDKFHQYYYGVDTQYATTDRAAYNAQGGYSGAQVLAGLNFEGPSYRAGIFARYNNLSGASFDDSPLIKQDGNLAFGFAYAWLF